MASAPRLPAPEPAYSYFVVGKVAATPAGSAEPGLLLAGGGEWDDAAFRWFTARAGHGHIVIISASGGAEAGEKFYHQVGAIASAETIEFHRREAAFDPKVLAILRHADGIFILGGDQSRYVRYWRNTPVARLLDEHVRAKPIGGTSAGLAILGAASYGAMDGGSIDSGTALHDPDGAGVTIVRNFLHMPFLCHVITDTHFTARNRLGRLIAFVAQVRSRWGPKVVGLGIDQGSALTVDKQGEARLYSNGQGFAWLVEPEGMRSSVPHQPLDYSAVKITGIGPQSMLNLRTLEVRGAAFKKDVAVRAGRVISLSDRTSSPK